MQSQDHFERAFETLVSALNRWADALRDTADVSVERSPAFWRLRLDPRVTGACPAEIILHGNQTFDLMIGSESYEALPLDNVDLIEPLLTAVSLGNVTTRTERSAVTDQPTKIMTIVGPPAAPLFERTRGLALAGHGTTTVARETHYLPYRRS